MAGEFQVEGQNAAALFTLRIHRGDGMSLVAMNWKGGKPPATFVGFAIEYKEPAGDKFYALKNRLTFPNASATDSNRFSSLDSPIQKFRWIHFPRNAELEGEYTYQVSPVFMNEKNELSYGEKQEAKLELRRETYPGQLNVAFTRGFVSSQAFVERYKNVSGILPTKANQGLKFKPTNPQAKDAWNWMGFEARQAILGVLDEALADASALVCVVAYDLNQPEVVGRLAKLGSRLKIIIDNSASHKPKGSAESQAASRLATSAGKENVKRQHMGSLQHNKFIAVDGPKAQLAVCGSTNFSWRAFFVQNNNAIVVQGKNAVKPFLAAFENYWNNKGDSVADFAKTPSVNWNPLGLSGIDVEVSCSPHSKTNARLQSVSDDVGKKMTSSLFYSLAFLYESPGPLRDAIKKVTKSAKLFVYGISDKKVGGIVLQKPDGNLAPLYPAALSGNLPQPFKSEPTGGGGTRMHHKFLVIDFDKPTARVYMGSYNFSVPADVKNGENLSVIRDRRIAVSYLVEALSMLDHYHFRVAQKEAKKKRKKLELALPPRKPGDKPWWGEYYSVTRKIRDRNLFA
jgi:phosphatidylserine/phosphatidylglycerophosphate/cardiolipin synthase-like enzyme